MVAPAYSEDTYVDHVLSANLDSSFAFEGPEKLLEVWFWPSPREIPLTFVREGLRSIPLEKWKEILDLVNCKILSMKSSPAVDSYLLSESSLFVFPHKMILKTCGTTTTLACLDELFEVARSYIGANSMSLSSPIDSKSVHKIFYSRRSFMFPQKQIHVHTDWKNEVKLLNLFFVCGKLYVLGDSSSDDHWYLYVGGTGNTSDDTKCGDDETFEILMTNLSPQKTKDFVAKRNPGAESLVESDSEDHDLGHDYGTEIMRKTGLDSVLNSAFSKPFPDVPSSEGDSMPSPQLSDNMELSDEEDSVKTSQVDFIHDGFAFTPCGFSSNSISDGKEGFYYTLHVTPESGWSYASFETNFPFSRNSSVNIVDVMLKVLKIFQPGRFSVTFFNDVDRSPAVNDSLLQLANCDAALAKLGYSKNERIVYSLQSGCNVLYLHFDKK